MKSALSILLLVVLIGVLPIGIIFVVFESLGIMEYVGPYFWYPFLGTIIIILLTGAIMTIVIFRARRRFASLNESSYQSFIEAPEKQYSRSAYFAVPTRCPSCHEPIELDQVSWTGPQTLSCPNCFTSVNVHIREM
jgi:hypothetical protein